MKRNLSFTLVELLTVIAVILLLTSILLPALSKARERVKTIQCLNNQKQLGSTFYMYYNDNQGYFPGSYINVKYYAYYLKSYFGEMASNYPVQVKCQSWNNVNSSKPQITYAMAHIYHNGAYLPYNVNYKPEAWVVKPSSMVILFDAIEKSTGGGYVNSMDYIYTGKQGRHLRGTNVLHYDGSVTTIFDYDGYMLNHWWN